MSRIVFWTALSRDELVQEENRDMAFTRVIQKHYPSHLNAQRQKATRETNLELKRMEKDAASDQFQMNYVVGVLQNVKLPRYLCRRELSDRIAAAHICIRSL